MFSFSGVGVILERVPRKHILPNTVRRSKGLGELHQGQQQHFEGQLSSEIRSRVNNRVQFINQFAAYFWL